VSIRKRFIGVAVVIAAVGTGSGIAFAKWSATGTGQGGAGAAVASTLTITSIIPVGPAANLYPGAPAGGVYFSINNPNPYAVTLTGVSYGTPVSTNATTCPNANVSVDPSAPTVVSIPVPANTTTSAIEILGVLDLSHNAPDGCQGVGFDVPIIATGAQQ
jgi:hypothetical protein